MWVGLMKMRRSLAVDIPKLKCFVCKSFGEEALQGDDAAAGVPQLVVPAISDAIVGADASVPQTETTFAIPDPPAVDPRTFTNLQVRCVHVE